MDVVYVLSKGEEIKIIYGVLVLSTGIKPQKKSTIDLMKKVRRTN